MILRWPLLNDGIIGRLAPADAIDRSVILRSASPSPTLPKKELAKGNASEAESNQSHDEDALREMITYDEDLNRLQASLMRSTPFPSSLPGSENPSPCHLPLHSDLPLDLNLESRCSSWKYTKSQSLDALREGFSLSTATNMVMEMGRAKHQKLEDDKNISENRERLNERLKQAGLRFEFLVSRLYHYHN